LEREELVEGLASALIENKPTIIIKNTGKNRLRE